MIAFLLMLFGPTRAARYGNFVVIRFHDKNICETAKNYLYGFPKGFFTKLHEDVSRGLK